jgi:hypothetical protein
MYSSQCARSAAPLCNASDSPVTRYLIRISPVASQVGVERRLKLVGEVSSPDAPEDRPTLWSDAGVPGPAPHCELLFPLPRHSRTQL